jgi:D-3-phosphoglycerate dehydrogenase / 2-oxoglutarate reductase
MRIVNFATDLYWSATEQAQLKLLGEFIQTPILPNNEIELIDWLRDINYAILAPLPRSSVSHRVFDQTPKLKGISLVTTGVDWIDTQAAKAKGIVISTPGDYSTISVAEFAIALMFSLVRKVTISANSTKDMKLLCGDFMGFELKEKVLGVIGMGSIGTYIAKLAQGIGMHVIAYNRTPKESSVPIVPIEQLLQQADIISVSLALNEHTKNFLDVDKLSLLKSTALVINVSREGLIDQEAMYNLLVAEKIRAYAFELDESRKFPIKKELLELNNVIATPHTAWYTSEAFLKLKQVTIANIRAMIDGNPINTI